MKTAIWIRAACLAAPVALLSACGGGADLDEGMTAKAVTINSDGEGFVGKGDVQLALGWTNKQLQQAHTSVQFMTRWTLVQEVSWECTNERNDKEMVRESTTRTRATSLLKSEERTRNQVTGFYLLGTDAESSKENVTTGGPQVNTCAGNQILTAPAGAPETVSSSLKLEVSGLNTGWAILYEE
jgi:hypothetical protein